MDILFSFRSLDFICVCKITFHPCLWIFSFHATEVGYGDLYDCHLHSKRVLSLVDRRNIPIWPKHWINIYIMAKSLYVGDSGMHWQYIGKVPHKLEIMLARSVYVGIYR